MRFIESVLRGAWLIELEPARDERGHFTRTFCVREFSEYGLETVFPQHSRSYSAVRGTLRGMHFQQTPHEEVKVVSCVRGAILDVIVDLRPDSDGFGRWQAFELTGDNNRQLYIPKGFAHGFQTLADDTEVSYLISACYVPSAAAGIRHDDPGLGIKWPLPVAAISEKDTRWPPLILPAAGTGGAPGNGLGSPAGMSDVKA